MQFQAAARAANKDEVKAGLAARFEALSAESEHPIDWTTATAAANVVIDGLADSEALDISVSVVGLVNYEADERQTISLSFSAMLVDRFA